MHGTMHDGRAMIGTEEMHGAVHRKVHGEMHKEMMHQETHGTPGGEAKRGMHAGRARGDTP
jgi:hypothetical protein